MTGKMIGTITVVTLSFLTALAVYTLMVAGEELAAATRFVIRATAIVLILGLGIALVYLAVKLFSGSLLAVERVKQERQKTAELTLQQRKTAAEIRKLEREADLTVVTAPLDHQVHISDTNPDAYWQARHLDARIYSNGPQSDPQPQPWELGLWLAARQKSGNPPVAPPADNPLLSVGAMLPDRVDLPDLLPGMRGSLRNIILGVRVNESGLVQPVSAPMFRLCHIGVAGATDSGKSNFGRAVAYQIITARENVQVIISDLKGTTFKAFQESTRLLYPIIHTTGEFMAVMDELSDEMRRRKKLFKPHPTVETLMDYNKLAEKPLPYLVIFVDEVTNLFLNRETQTITLEMLREARAFGMYFMAMGQSWSHREMNTSIRQQFRTGLHFGTNDPASSRMIVNSSDAAKIVTPGRALASLPFGMASGATEIQTPYLDVATTLRALDQLDEPVPESTRPMPLPAAIEEEAPQPTEKQAKVLELWDQGITKKDVLSRQVYGRVGGRQYQLIEAALSKFGRI